MKSEISLYGTQLQASCQPWGKEGCHLSAVQAAVQVDKKGVPLV